MSISGDTVVEQKRVICESASRMFDESIDSMLDNEHSLERLIETVGRLSDYSNDDTRTLLLLLRCVLIDYRSACYVH